MSQLLDRVKNIFRKNKKSRRLPPGSYPQASRNEPMTATVTKPTDPTDDDDYIDDSGSGSYDSYNVPEQTRARNNAAPAPTRNPATGGIAGGINSSILSNPLNPPTPFSNLAPAQRGNPVPQPSSGGFPPGMNPNPSAPTRGAPPDLNSNPSAPTRGAPPGLNSNPSAPTRGAPPGLNSNPSAPTRGAPPGLNPNPSAPTDNPPSSLGGFPFGMNPNPAASGGVPPAPGGIPPGMNSNQPSDAPPANKPMTGLAALFKGIGGNPASGSQPAQDANQAPPYPAGQNPQSSLPGFPPGMNINPSSAQSTHPQQNANHAHSHHRTPLVHRRSSRSNSSDDNVSRLELDYPIENVLIDGNIPSSMAIKVNEAVEHDRLGNAYHVHRYTFEPPLQKLSVGNKEQIDRHLVENPQQGGKRHIREIYDNNHNPLVYDIGDQVHSHRHQPRRRSYSEAELNHYLDQIIQRPGSFVVHAQNTDDLQAKINQYIYNNNNQILTPQYPTLPPQFSTNTIAEPVFYYTARALTNDPMRYY